MSFLVNPAVSARMPSAMGRSNPEPSFLMSAGARLIMMSRRRNVAPAILQRGRDAVATLADGGVGQANGVEVVLIGLDARNVDLDLNNVGVDAVDGGAESFVEHEVGSRSTFTG